MFRTFGVILSGATIFSLSACGGGGGTSGGGTGGGGGSSSYTIGGTVTGLSGTKLNLLNNGTDILTVAGNGNFTFSNAVTSGGAYEVTIYGEPLNPLQFCTVANGSGTAEVNITNIQITCATPSEKTLHSFGSLPDGGSPTGSLVFDGSGNLYGTTSAGGAYGWGTVFKLAPSQGQWMETVLYSFCPPNQAVPCADGSTPYSGVVFDSAGNLYGTTYMGGAYANSTEAKEGVGGVVFELTPNANGSWTESVIHSFGSGTDGNEPYAGVVFDKQGNLYGTTVFGGNLAGCADSCGTVYELSPGSNGQWTESVIYALCQQASCADGYGPYAGVVLDSSGNLYGTANYGGILGNDGTVFELSPGGNGKWTETTLYQFQGGDTDGANPHAGVILDSSGNLYGTTVFGFATQWGANNGIVFELAHQSGGPWTEKVLYGFCGEENCTDGTSPYAGLVFDKAGNLYGLANSAATFGNGAAFALTPGAPNTLFAPNTLWNEVPLYSFGGGSDGYSTVWSPIVDSAGNLYGAAAYGGANGGGLVFEITM